MIRIRPRWVTVCLVAASIAVAAGSGQVHSDRKHGFALLVPNGWIARPLGESTQVVRGDAYVSVLAFEGTSDASELLQTVGRSVGAKWKRFASVGRGKAELAGLSGVTETFTGVNAQGIEAALQLQSIVHERTGFVIVIGYPVKEADKYRPELAEIVRSFSLSARVPETESGAAELGVLTTDLSPEDARAYGLEQAAGALVVEISPGGAGHRAAVKVHDLIVTAGEERVDSAADLEQVLAAHHPGDKLVLDLIRIGSDEKPLQLSVAVTLGAKQAR